MLNGCLNTVSRHAMKLGCLYAKIINDGRFTNLANRTKVWTSVQNYEWAWEPPPLSQGGHGEGDQLKAETTMVTLTAGPRTPDTEKLQLAGQLLHLVLAEKL